VKRWFRFSLRSEEAEGQVTTKVEEGATPEAEDRLIPAAELPPAAKMLSEIFGETPTAESAAGADPAEDTPQPANVSPDQASATADRAESLPISRTLDALFPNAPEFHPGDRRESTQETWKPLPVELPGFEGRQEGVISSSELPSASHILAELFPAERISLEHPGTGEANDGSAADESHQETAAPLASEAPSEEPVRASQEAPSVAEFANDEASSLADEQFPELPEPDAALAHSTDERFAAMQDFRPPYRDWAFEEKLASHKEWVDSHGVSGKRGDFAGADLEGTELIGVNFRFADFHDANLRAADLLLADLRDACLVRADLQDACLVGANLEGANLEDASLETAMGLVPRQIAGANLRDASLPASFLEFPAAAALEKAARSVAHYFAAMTTASAICWLVLWKTKDVQLVADSAILPFLHSRAAATALPTAESYLILPVGLFLLYLVFQFRLQKVWDAVLELPAVFPDGRAVAEGKSGIVLALMRAHFRWIDQDSSSTRLVEKSVSSVLAYWMVPATLLLFWARYLTRQEVRGTLLHALLVVAATAVAVYTTTKTGRPPERWALERKWTDRVGAKLRKINPATVACALGVVLLFLSVGTIAGAPHDRRRAPQYSASSVRRWAATALWSIGFDPYADLTEANISTRPANWNGSDAQAASAAGPRLNSARLRYAQAYGAFLVNAHLWHANLQGAYLSEADMRGADLAQADLRLALMDHTNLKGANLDRAVLDGADMRRANLQNANLSHSSLVDGTLTDADLDGATFYAAQLSSSTLTRANFQKADLREVYLDKISAEHADFRGAYLWSARLPDADLRGAQMGNAILIDAYLPNADLRWAQFAGTVLSGANITGANLDGADMRGAGGLDANQVCSAKSHSGTLLDAALAAQVAAQCGPPTASISAPGGSPSASPATPAARQAAALATGSRQGSH